VSATDDYKRLKEQFAKLEAHRRAIAEARRKVGKRAVEQHDSMHGVVDAWAKEVEEGRGGILSHRRLRTLLTERSRLAAIVHRHEHADG
jgi:hypothetical protein